MNWLDHTLDDLAARPGVGYLTGGAAAAEPTALAALALSAHGRLESARRTADVLASMQQTSGAVGIRSGETPGWPTSLAVVAWSAVGNALRGVPPAPRVESESTERHRGRSLQVCIDGAIAWLLANRGKPIERSDNFGHNTELVGWAYAEQTHSWVEPTALAVLALKAAGKADNAAAGEGTTVLLDRQLPGGGLNYGNTYVLGQLIRPHVQPTGVGLLALAGEPDPSGRVAKSIAWLKRSIGPDTTPLSLGWALLGLHAHGIDPSQAAEWLTAAAQRVQSRDRAPHKLALLALAAKGWPV